MPIIGLTKELEYKAGSIVPTVKRVIEMPRAVNEGPRPTPPGEPSASATEEHPPRVSGIRLDPSESKIGKLLLGDVAVQRGEVLLTLEAMKMEAAVRAERDGTVAEVIARPGLAVDAKDLLVVFA